ncbi:hypothetical protein KP509_36G044300 [Ceratopteris richardii]|uniref:Uncharacterized protein n=1 Tax=Ceratopteris richardii TaxID=49495 RepID=A0A8T2QBI0_CERRI|nr:hypothetical protein KP509_36G044300 [Ceratopteris richardii]
MKCIWCEKYRVEGPWGKGDGCKIILNNAIRKHNLSIEHLLVLACLIDRGHALEQEVLGVELQIAKQDLALAKYEALYELAYALDVKDMPQHKDYSSSINAIAEKKNIVCISKYLKIQQRNYFLRSPYYSLMLDKSTDKSLEKYLIVYISFLEKYGFGYCKCQFLHLDTVKDRHANTKYDSLLNMLCEMGLNLRKLIGISTDGHSSMLGYLEGLVAKLTRDFPNLIYVHCVAHTASLALIIDACKMYPCLSYIDTIANKIYSWISASSLRHAEFKKSLEDMNNQALDALQIHNNLKSFFDTLYYGFEGMNFKDAWIVFSNTLHWHQTFPSLLKLWQMVLVLPISSPPCQRGFSKHKIIKNDHHQCLNIKTFDMLVRISLLGPTYAPMDWEEIYAIWEESRDHRISDL